MAYNSFPYTNMHELNLDYLLNKSKEVDANVQAAAGSASAAASSAAAASESAESSLAYSRNSANSAAAAEASAADSADSARIAAAAAGDPVTFTAASQLTNTGKIYVYIGETGTYTYGHWYYYAGGSWVDGGVYGTWTTDNALNDTSTNAVQNKVINGAINNLTNNISAVVDTVGTNVNTAVSFEQGTINGSSGGISSSNTRCRTGYINSPSNLGFIINFPSEYKYTIYEYTTGAVSGYTGSPLMVWAVGKTYLPIEQGHYIKIVAAFTDDAAITPDQIVNYTIAEYDYTVINSLALNVGPLVEQIPANADLNDYTNPGNYRCVSQAISNTLVNSPSDKPFRLTVLNTTAVNYLTQIITDTVNREYTRSKIYSNWSDWEMVDKYTYQPSGSDDTAAILSRLTNNGYCKLGIGTYNVSGLIMPANSKLIGQGNSTVIVNATTTTCISMTAGCSVSSVKIVGSHGDSWTPDGSITNDHGILIDTYGDADNNRNRINIDNVEICGFGGGAFCFNETGYNYDNSANVVNCYTHNNNVGIYIPASSEFNRFTNIQNGRNYYGCINNGGNNVFVNCGFNGNTQGLLMDNTGGAAPNNSHGSFVGCTFNHSGGNTGKAVEIINMASGEVFSACQFFYGEIRIVDCTGVQLNGCNFGNTTPINVSGGANLMIGCVCISRTQTPITVTNNGVFHAVNCYSRAGVLYTDFE